MDKKIPILIWVGTITGWLLVLYGFLKPDLISVVGGVTILFMTWLHLRAVRGR